MIFWKYSFFCLKLTSERVKLWWPFCALEALIWASVLYEIAHALCYTCAIWSSLTVYSLLFLMQRIAVSILEFLWCWASIQSIFCIAVYALVLMLWKLKCDLLYTTYHMQYVILAPSGQAWKTVPFAAFDAANSSQHVGISLMLFCPPVNVAYLNLCGVEAQMWASAHYLIAHTVCYQ